jgi:hypothetical protein
MKNCKVVLTKSTDFLNVPTRDKFQVVTRRPVAGDDPKNVGQTPLLLTVEQWQKCGISSGPIEDMAKR